MATTNEKVFKKIVNKLCPMNIGDNSKKFDRLAIDSNGQFIKCEDQCIGIIEIMISKCGDGYIKWITSIESIENRTLAIKIEKKKKIPIIAIVLESPHKNEFFKAGKKRNLPMPAMGETGRNIKDFFPEMLMKYILLKNDTIGAYTNSTRDIENGKYRIKLVNFIQYQCSLGMKSTMYKEKVLEECLNSKQLLDDFKARLKNYSPHIVINCCTSGRSNLQDKVQEIINDIQCIKLIGWHPSYLSFLKGFRKPS